jgi:hypothetical protein
MKQLKSKVMIIATVIVVTLVVLFLIGRKSVHSEIIISAQPQEVWQVLMDKEAYREWNPVLIPLSGELEAGAKVNYEFAQDENTKSEITSTVKKIVDKELLNQGGGIPGVLTFNHKYILESVEGGTKVTIHEDYRGIGVTFWNPKPVEKAYERLNEALKERVMELQ